MFEKIKSFLSAATSLPVIPTPKVPNKPQAQPSFSKRTATTKGDQKLLTSDRRTANLDILSLRNGTSTKAVIRDLAAVSPDMASAVASYIRTVVTREYTAVARNLDGTINDQATNLAQQLLIRMGHLQDYQAGFSSSCVGIHSVAEQLTKELRLYGSCALELVLDKARTPSRLQPISTTQIEFYDDGSGNVRPVQRVSGQEIDLDYPTVFIESLDQDLTEAYSASPMEPGLHASLADIEFQRDLRRVIKRGLHPRMNVSIDSEKWRKAIPLDVLADAEKLSAYQENFMNSVTDTVTNLDVDEALVAFDSLNFSILNNENSSLSAEWETTQQIINAKLSTGMQVPPSVLGHGSGSANIASAEIQLFLKSASGVQTKINNIISRAMTLAVRLLGVDAFVEFRFSEAELRPSSELEAFKSMAQSRVLMQLSLGLISDSEAAIALTGRLPPKGYKPLSGTFFMAGATDPNAVDTASAQSNTGALQQSLDPGTPKAVPGSAKNDPKNQTLQRVK